NKLAIFAKENNIDLTIVGPEGPLTEGVVDIFRANDLVIFGPTAAAARLEGSKAYMKNILKKYNIPTAGFIETSNKQEAFDFIDSMTNLPIVVKADGLCAGKGVIIASSKEEAKETVADMLSGNSFGDAGSTVVVEEYLDGYELSVTPVSELFYKGATKQLDKLEIKIKKEYGVAVVMASKNYPYGDSEPAEIIVDEIHDEILKANSHISYAGVSKEDGKLFATGGRVLLCVGFGEDIQTARNRAYALCGQVHFAGKKCRTDIAYQALK
ncbi:MAG: ATP-grasp domain-containing protein, partial [Arcobacter sp.]|nr:ATP-grasp domain-containing protein [Arcobacter sp.]